MNTGMKIANIFFFFNLVMAFRKHQAGNVLVVKQEANIDEVNELYHTVST